MKIVKNRSAKHRRPHLTEKTIKETTLALYMMALPMLGMLENSITKIFLLMACTIAIAYTAVDIYKAQKRAEYYRDIEKYKNKQATKTIKQ